MKQTKLFLSLLMLVALSIGNVWGKTATVGDVLWAENFAHFDNNTPSTAKTGNGTTIFGGATITYAQSSNNTKSYNESLANGTAPELLLSKKSDNTNSTWTISGLPTGDATEMALTFLSNKTSFSLTTTSSDLVISGTSTSWTIKVAEGKSAPKTFDLTLYNTATSNARIDNVKLAVTIASSASPAISSIAVATSPTKVNYTEGEKFDPTGLVLTATMSEGDPQTITYSEDTKSIFSFSPNLETALQTTDSKVTVTYGGQSTDITISVAELAKQTYEKVTDASTLAAGDILLFGCKENGTISGAFNSSYLSSVSDKVTFTEDGNSVTALAENEITLGGKSGEWTFTIGDKLLGATAAKKMALGNTSATNTWTISIAEGGATIASTNTDYGSIQYDKNDPRFLNYTSGQTAIELYRVVNTTPKISAVSNVTIDAVMNDYGYIDVTYSNISDINLVDNVRVFTDVECTTEAGKDFWLTANYQDNTAKSKIEYIAEDNTGAERTAYIYLSAYAEDLETIVAEKVITITQAKASAKLTSIKIDATNAQTTYIEGETFSTEGLKVIGTYSDDTEKEIAADAITWDYTPKEPLKTTDTKVTISANVQNLSDITEITINVTAAPKSVTFDLTKDETKTASINELTWEKENIASMTLEKGKSLTDANNYYPNKDNSNTHTRFYKDQVWTITPATGKSVTKIEVITTGSEYATKLGKSTFTNATAEAISSNVIITPKDYEDAISCTISNATYIKTITIYYAEAVNPKITCDSKLKLTDTKVSTTTFPVTFERTEMVTADLFTDAECTTKITYSWFQVDVAEEAPFTISYSADANTTNTERTVYMKIEAANMSSPVTAQKVVTVTQAKGIPTFASLEELVAADIATETTVRVTFTNAVIKEIATNSSGYRRGIYFDIQKNGEDIEIYYPYTVVPAEWVQGGKLSGIMTCPWTKYNDTWELAPNKGSWDWNSLTYTEPAAIHHIVISGKATKTEYTEGDIFDPAGLVVTAIDTENGETDVTSLATWSFDPAVLTLGTTSVTATASYNSKTANISIPVTINALSEKYTFTSLEDLAKAEIPSETMVKVSFIAEIKAFTKAKNGVYFNIQKEGEDIEIYYPTTNILDNWEVGGSLSGTIVAPWQRYSYTDNKTQEEVFVCWELAPKEGTWDWTELTYAPAPKVLSIAIGGTPKTTYTEGDMFSNEYLTVTATLDNNTTKDVTNDVTWEITPSTALTITTTSVSVKAVYGEIESNPVSYNITVQEKQMEGDPIVIAFEYKDSYYALKTDLTVYTFPDDAGVVAGKMVNIPKADRTSITWYRASAEGGVTFQRKSDGKYLSATATKTDISAEKTACIWKQNDDYYTVELNPESGKQVRTLLLQILQNGKSIKNYGVGNIGGNGYSDVAMYLSEYIDGEIANVRDLNGNIGTLCLAKKVIAFEGAQFYRIYSKDAVASASVKNVTFEEITETLEAGEACIFEPEDGATQIRVVYTGDAVTAPLPGNGLVGIFEDVDDLRTYTENKGVDYADVFVVQNNRIRKAGEGLTSVPNRAYINMRQVECNVPQKAGRRYIVLGKENTGTTTGIDGVQTDNAPLGTYDVLGRKVGETSAAGLYIINGKKVLIVK